MNTVMENKIQEFLNGINDTRGKSKSSDGIYTSWPTCFKYSFNKAQEICTIEYIETERAGKQNFRRLDPWGLVFIEEMRKITPTNIKGIHFIIKESNSPHDIEAFKRRISFLAFNNSKISFTVSIDGQNMSLYNKKELFERPDNEIIRENINVGHDKDKPGRLEKDFQVFLFGKDLEKRTNERLAVLGEDFFKIKNKEYKLFREFPTGVFQKKISKSSRILPTERVDLVTLNKWSELAVVELKLDNPELSLISQLLDYSLFFKCYTKLLSPILQQRLGRFKNEKLICYMVNNHFHPKMRDIRNYYSTEGKNYGFELRQVILGFIETI